MFQRSIRDDGGSKDLWNIGKLLPDYMAYNPEDSHLCTHHCENLESYWLNTDNQNYFIEHIENYDFTNVWQGN
jgi:hypothetical protein